MIQPNELKLNLPMELSNGVMSLTTKVWDILVASRNGDLDKVQKMAKTMRNLTILLFLTAFIACTSKKQDIKAKDFLVSVKSMKADTVINSAVYYAGHILCLQGDDKLFVLDTTLNLVDSLTAKFSKLKIQLLHSYNDTILLSTGKDIFFLKQVLY